MGSSLPVSALFIKARINDQRELPQEALKIPPKTAIAVGEARGIALLVLEQNNIPIKEFTPLQVKNAVTGYGKADKRQVQENVKVLCNLKEIPKPDDAADAIAIAIAAYS